MIYWSHCYNFTVNIFYYFDITVKFFRLSVKSFLGWPSAELGVVLMSLTVSMHLYFLSYHLRLVFR